MTTSRILTVDKASANSTFQGQQVRKFTVTFWDNGAVAPTGSEFNYDLVDSDGVTQRFYGWEDAGTTPPTYGIYRTQSTYDPATAKALAKGGSYSYTNRREALAWGVGNYATEQVTVEYYGAEPVTTSAGTFQACHYKVTTTADSVDVDFKLNAIEEVWQTKDVRIRKLSSERQTAQDGTLLFGRDEEQTVVGYVKDGVAYGNVSQTP
ncbi:hypothetical protein [Chitiniphilus shinanonensis]|uniref:hypothetical protein n=1 Tax=Chitiniphilus shinanonensis TaxID=553088 RepID=UPI0030453781